MTALVAVLILVPAEGRSLIADEVVRPSTTTTTPTTTTPTAPGSTGSPPPSSVVSTVAPDPTTVLVLGDSTALSLVAQRSIDLEPDWNIQAFARVGCSISGGNPVDVDSDLAIIQGEECARWRTEWTDAFMQVEPDIAVVMVGAWEVLDHRVDGVDVEFPDPAWFELVRSAVRDAIAIAGTDGTPVALLALPCMQQSADTLLPAQARNDVVRVSAFNSILREEAAADPNVHVIELQDRLCPGGTYLDEVDGAQLRYDGVHVSPEGADYVWPWLLDELSSLVRAFSPDADGQTDSSPTTPR